MQQELADITTNEATLLKGFKVLGVFPFYLKYIKVSTHIKLCKIKDQILKQSPEKMEVQDFFSAGIQAKIMPLVLQYCLIGLLNDRAGKWLFYWFVKRRLNQCGHYHILNIFLMLQKLNEPAFFLTYWTLIKKMDNILLKEEKQ